VKPVRNPFSTGFFFSDETGNSTTVVLKFLCLGFLKLGQMLFHTLNLSAEMLKVFFHLGNHLLFRGKPPDAIPRVTATTVAMVPVFPHAVMTGMPKATILMMTAKPKSTFMTHFSSSLRDSSDMHFVQLIHLYLMPPTSGPDSA
jgi:hypothetical protein